MTNPNSSLDPQNNTHALAVITPEELEEQCDRDYDFFNAGPSDGGHIYPDDGDYDPSSDF